MIQDMLRIAGMGHASPGDLKHESLALLRYVWSQEEKTDIDAALVALGVSRDCVDDLRKQHCLSRKNKLNSRGLNTVIQHVADIRVNYCATTTQQNAIDIVNALATGLTFSYEKKLQLFNEMNDLNERIEDARGTLYHEFVVELRENILKQYPSADGITYPNFHGGWELGSNILSLNPQYATTAEALADEAEVQGYYKDKKVLTVCVADCDGTSVHLGDSRLMNKNSELWLESYAMQTAHIAHMRRLEKAFKETLKTVVAEYNS